MPSDNNTRYSTKKDFDDHLKERHSWFCGQDRDPNSIDNLKKYLNEFDLYAYIIHDKDIDLDGSKKSPHIHWVVRANGTRTIKTVSEVLGVDPHFVQTCGRNRSVIRYLLHLDDPDKHQYFEQEIITNDLDEIHSFLVNEECKTPQDMLEDFVKLRNGEIALRDYLLMYHLQFSKLSFYQKNMLLERLSKIALN